jgi:RNA polymerase sigma-70 factor (ECF subfamily)
MSLHLLQVVRRPPIVPAIAKFLRRFGHRLEGAPNLPAVDPLSRLARDAQAGDDQALTALVAAAYEPIWRLCATLTDADSADDLAQEAVLRAARSLHNYRGDSTARAWLLAIARHTCIDEIRARTRRRRRDHHSLERSVNQPRHDCDASETSVVADLLHRLEPDRRTAFTLTQILGLTYHEAAQVSDCPPGTIRSRVARARADLLAMLEAAEEPHPQPQPGSARSNTA